VAQTLATDCTVLWGSLGNRSKTSLSGSI